MTRFLTTCVLIAAGILAAPVSAAPTDQPNILWITCEDISPNLGCYGDSYARTPNLDALAARGTRYTHAFAPIGVCAPARSTIITGVWPPSIGTHNMRCQIKLPEHIRCFPEFLRKAGYYCTNNVKTDYNFKHPASTWDECSKQAHWRKRKPGQPFFSVFNFITTHESRIRQADKDFFYMTRKLKPDQRHDPKRVPLPPQHPDTPEVRQDWARYHDLITAMDYQVGDLLKQLADDGLADNTIVFYYSDHGAGMPGYKRWLWDSGIRVPMLVHFPEKYRKWAPGPDGGTTDRLVSFLDLAPTVLSLAGVKIPGYMQGTAFLGPQAGAPQEYVYGFRDRMDGRYDCIRTVRGQRYHYLRNYMPHVTWAQYLSYLYEMPTMRVWQRLADAGQLNPVQARYFSPTKPVEELYDTEADPYEIRNLADLPEYASTLARMRQAAEAWMLTTHDMGLIPENEMHRLAGNAPPFTVGQDPVRYPQKRVMAAADLANRMDPKALGELTGLLKDDNAIVRYWGAVGLAALGVKAQPAADALAATLTDDSPDVRIAAASALCRMGRIDQGLPSLIAALKDPAGWARLRALLTIDDLGEKARAAWPKVPGAKMEDDPAAKYLDRVIAHITQTP